MTNGNGDSEAQLPTAVALSPLEPAFKVGDRICRNSTKSIGIVTEVKLWRLNKIAYRIAGDGFHPGHYFGEKILCLSPYPEVHDDPR